MKTDFNLLIPELKDWNNGQGIDIESWIGCMGDFEKAIGYSVIFWPSFVEIEGCVFHLSNTPATSDLAPPSRLLG